jgi:hypothetical protein
VRPPDGSFSAGPRATTATRSGDQGPRSAKLRQIVNEPAYWFTPQEYAAYHRRLTPLIRRLAPGVPIVAGDFGIQANGRNTLGMRQTAVAAGASDYDVLSVHATGVRRRGELADFARRLQAFRRPGLRVWITEGDWGHLPCLFGQGVDVEEDFVYTWNDDTVPDLVRRPGGRLSNGPVPDRRPR